MIVISNTSPISNLAAIGQLDLLRQLYQEVVIPQAVQDELLADNGIHPCAVIQTQNWIKLRAVANRALVTALQAELDEGEAETIALAIEMSASLVLMDERIGRVVAGRFNLRVIGLLGVLIEARQSGLVSEIKPLLNALIQAGFWISQDLFTRVLQAAGE